MHQLRPTIVASRALSYSRKCIRRSFHCRTNPVFIKPRADTQISARQHVRTNARRYYSNSQIGTIRQGNNHILYGGTALVGCAAVISVAILQHQSQTNVTQTEAQAGTTVVTPTTEEHDILDDLKHSILGLLGSNSDENTEEHKDSPVEEIQNNINNSTSDTTNAKNSSNTFEGPGKKVVVDLDPELVEELPVMSLEEVQKCNGLNGTEQLLVSYDGIVYDVTEFANAHPGGKDLLLTAAGLDLSHFFSNYTVHGNTHKASQWLEPLAVGKLSAEDAVKAQNATSPAVHVEKRMKLLHRARQKIVLVASTLPFWMTLRSIVRLVGSIIPPLGRFIANILPVTVPGYTHGSEQLTCSPNEEHTVAVIGGGIAGCGAAWTLKKSGFKVTLFEAREKISGNARTFEWDFSPYREVGEDPTVKSCVSVTAWPPVFYKNYTALLKYLDIETVHQPLSWFLNSKVPGAEGTLWAADPTVYDGSLRKVFEKDFRLYKAVERFSKYTCDLFTLRWARPKDTPSMYDSHTGLGLLNPLNIIPLYSLFKAIGGSDLWWEVIFTPHYTASFLVDELRPFPAVFGPLIEAQIPLNPNESNTWKGSSKERGEIDCNITTCVTWKDAGKGIREVFDKMMENIDLRENVRVREIEILSNGKKRVHDENDGYIDVDRVVFACPSNAVGNIHKAHGKLEEMIFSTPVYADDHHPSSGHMHAVMHSDGSVVDKKYREDVLKRASNYVEITRKENGEINMENQYNFGVQTPGLGIYDLPLDKKPVMLISHALGDGKSIDPDLVRGTGNHARAHPLYSGWNVMAQLSLRLVQGRDGIYYCSNWTTPGNCHDMSLLSGIVCAHAIGAEYPFEGNVEAKKDFSRLRDLMGI